jgi:hypothetical protein
MWHHRSPCHWTHIAHRILKSLDAIRLPERVPRQINGQLQKLHKEAAEFDEILVVKLGAGVKLLGNPIRHRVHLVADGKGVVSTKGKTKGKPMPDSDLRDTENVPLNEDVELYFEREVLPHAPDGRSIR